MWYIIHYAQLVLQLTPTSLVVALLIVLGLQPSRVMAMVNITLEFFQSLPYRDSNTAEFKLLVPIVFSPELLYDVLLTTIMLLALAWGTRQLQLWLARGKQARSPYFLQNVGTIMMVFIAFYLSISALVYAPLAGGEGVVPTNFREDLHTDIKPLTRFDTTRQRTFVELINDFESFLAQSIFEGVQAGAIDSTYLSAAVYAKIEAGDIQAEVTMVFAALMKSMEQDALEQMEEIDAANLVTNLKL